MLHQIVTFPICVTFEDLKSILRHSIWYSCIFGHQYWLEGTLIKLGDFTFHQCFFNWVVSWSRSQIDGKKSCSNEYTTTEESHTGHEKLYYSIIPDQRWSPSSLSSTPNAKNQENNLHLPHSQEPNLNCSEQFEVLFSLNATNLFFAKTQLNERSHIYYGW